MGGKGSTKDEREVNTRKAERAKEREAEARKNLKFLKAQPVVVRAEDWFDQLRRWQGILKKAQTDRRKSESHGRNGKGGHK